MYFFNIFLDLKIKLCSNQTMLVLATIILCSLVYNIQCEDTSCNGLYQNFSQHLSSKTPYRYIANYDTKPIEFNGKNIIFLDIIIILLSGM